MCTPFVARELHSYAPYLILCYFHNYCFCFYLSVALSLARSLSRNFFHVDLSRNTIEHSTSDRCEYFRNAFPCHCVCVCVCAKMMIQTASIVYTSCTATAIRMQRRTREREKKVATKQPRHIWVMTRYTMHTLNSAIIFQQENRHDCNKFCVDFSASFHKCVCLNNCGRNVF